MFQLLQNKRKSHTVTTRVQERIKIKNRYYLQLCSSSSIHRMLKEDLHFQLVQFISLLTIHRGRLSARQ